VQIELFVRDICRLRPGLPGVSESITVRSVVGRFLEHSRIMRIEVGDAAEYFIGSADWMTRNLDRRVEAVAPIDAPRLQQRLDAILAAYAADTRNSWEMRSDGSYRKLLAPAEPFDVHAAFMRRAVDGEENV
jgi:polyphosphate kinase